MTRVAVLIATYKRPDELARLFVSLEAGIGGVDTSIDIVVADNDPEGSAAAVVARTTHVANAAVHYVHEPTPGIPAVRNALLEAAGDAEYIAFIDDDEVADPGWLRALVDTARRFEADVVSGPVIYEFPGPPSPAVAAAPCFAVPRRTTGSMDPWPRTGNVLVRRSVLDRTGVRFREEYALTGGSDRALFDELLLRGARVVWCDEAVVRECVPADRATLGYVVRRGLRIGNTTAVAERDVAPSRRRLALRAVKAAGWFVRGSITCIGGLLSRRPALTSRGAWHAARGVGMALGLLGRRVVGYPRS